MSYPQLGLVLPLNQHFPSNSGLLGPVLSRLSIHILAVLGDLPQFVLAMVHNAFHHGKAVPIQIDFRQHVLGNNVGTVLLDLSIGKFYLIQNGDKIWIGIKCSGNLLIGPKHSLDNLSHCIFLTLSHLHLCIQQSIVGRVLVDQFSSSINIILTIRNKFQLIIIIHV